MTYYADLSHDLPAPHKRKKVIFYGGGLKIYGLLPYLLQRKLKAQFFSGSIGRGGMRVSLGSAEENWTAIPYNQSTENVDALLAWLYGESGFAVALASREDWEDNIFSSNVFRIPPKTWFPADGTMHSGFLQVTTGQSGRTEETLRCLLVLPSGKA